MSRFQIYYYVPRLKLENTVYLHAIDIHGREGYYWKKSGE